MNAARAGWLVRLYPRPFRDRWGEDIVAELRGATLRAVPGLLYGIADSWLHPLLWPVDPATDRGTARRHRALVTAAVVAAGSWYLVHLVAELDSRPAGGRAHLIDACVGALLAGLVLVAPRPRAPLPVLAGVVPRLARGLCPPALLAAAVVAWVRVGPTGLPAIRLALLVGWYAALAWAAVRCCQMLGRYAAFLVPPSRWRLLIGLGALAVSTLGAALILVAPSLAVAGPDPFAVAAALGLLLLAGACVSTLRQLGRVEPGPAAGGSGRVGAQRAG